MRRQYKSAAPVVVFASLALVAASCSRDPQKQKQEYLNSGNAYFEQKKYSEAIIQYRNAINIDPRLGDTRLQLGQAYAATGDGLNALREYIRAADLLPENLNAQLAAGTGLLAARQFEDATARARTVLAKEPGNVQALLLLGNSLAGLKDLDGAIAQIEEAIDSEPRRTLSYSNLGQLELAKGDKAAAESAFKRAVAADPKSVDAHLSLANYYWATKATASAEGELKLAYALDRKSPLANRALAVFYVASGRVDESEQYLKAMAELTTEAGPKLVLADFLIAKKRVPEATSVLQSLLQTPDGFAPAQRRLAALDFASGRRREAHDGLARIFERLPKDEDTHLQQARFLMVEGNFAGALAEAGVVVKENPRSAAGHFARGLALKSSGDLDGAGAAFREVVRVRPGTVPALVQLADIAQAAGDFTSTLDFAGEAIKSQPQNGLAHLLRARALLQTRDVTKLETEVAALLNSAPADADVQILAGDYFSLKRDSARAQSAYEKALAARPDSVPALAGLVKQDLAAGKPLVARARVDAQLAKRPDSDDLLLLAARTYLTLHELQPAEAAFRRVVQANPSNLLGYRALAAFYMQQKRLEEARTEFEELARRSPKDAVSATTMVGMILEAQGKGDEAQAQYERVINLDPGSPVAANNLAWAYADSGRDLDLALKFAQTAKSKLPDNADVNDTMGWVYYKKDLAGLAVSSFEAAAKQAPANASIRYRLGLAYAKTGNIAKARDAFAQALKMDPAFKESADARRQLEMLKS